MTPCEKIAFVHFAKVAGRYVNYYLCRHVFQSGGNNLAEQQYKVFNSWQHQFSLGRDWTEAELIQLAGNRFPAQFPTPAQVRAHHRRWNYDYLSKQYVHNHHYTWTPSAIRAFRRNGWFCFMFIREPAELLCSLWTWIQAAGNDSASLISPSRLAGLSLDAFLREVVGTPELHGFYALPPYIDVIDYVAEFTQENFGNFLEDRFCHHYRPELAGQQQRYASGNPGYSAYRSLGLIGDKTHALINADSDVGLVRERLGMACAKPDNP